MSDVRIVELPDSGWRDRYYMLYRGPYYIRKAARDEEGLATIGRDEVLESYGERDVQVEFDWENSRVRFYTSDESVDITYNIAEVTII